MQTPCAREMMMDGRERTPGGLPTSVGRWQLGAAICTTCGCLSPPCHAARPQHSTRLASCVPEKCPPRSTAASASHGTRDTSPKALRCRPICCCCSTRALDRTACASYLRMPQITRRKKQREADRRSQPVGDGRQNQPARARNHLPIPPPSSLTIRTLTIHTLTRTTSHVYCRPHPPRDPRRCWTPPVPRFRTGLGQGGRQAARRRPR